MKTITIPYYITKAKHEALFSDFILDVFQKLNADRISLVFDDWEDFETNRQIIRHAIEHFSRHGLDVAVWLNSLLHIEHKGNFTKKKYADGTEKHCCPLDKDFIVYFANYVAEYAKSGVRLIYLDDDFRFGTSGGTNCFCDLHMQEYRKLLGEDVTAEVMIEAIASGKPNRYRNAWIKVNGDALRGLAEAIRAEVNKVDPSVRVGVCAAPTTMYGLEESSAFELSEILAGDTEPFLRLIGAPYWADYSKGLNARLGDVIGAERLELSYAEENGFKGEILSEGDTYQRTRFDCPASYLELYHSALFSEKRMDGILKYPGEYTSYKDTYENGFSRLAPRNRAKLDRMTEAFEETEKVGFKILEVRDKTATEVYLQEDMEALEFERVALPASIRAFTDLSLPYTFRGNEPTVAFGDNASYLTQVDFKNGIVTDLVGARILKEKGFDVGIEAFGDTVTVHSCQERYHDYDDVMNVSFWRWTGASLCGLDLNPAARVLTSTEIDGKNYPLTYCYCGADMKLAVCCVDVTQVRFSYGYFKCYYKQRIFAELYRWFKNESLAVTCFDSPFLTQIVGKKEGKLVIGLWNIFPDMVFDREICLNRAYAKAEFIGCNGSLHGDRIVLDSLAAYDFCAIVLEE